MSYTELTVWTRGIIMDKEGRDIVNSIAAAGRLEGKFAQAMENYVDNPDRTNAPTRKYCRLSESEIENALTYENEQPNIVVLVETDDGEGLGLHAGMPPGGTLVTHPLHTDYMIRRAQTRAACRSSCASTRQLADKVAYYRLGRARSIRLSTEGRRSEQAIAPDIAAPLIAAVSRRPAS